ncbi:unnamed protein product, partial [Protopolystoma xenopodis]
MVTSNVDAGTEVASKVDPIPNEPGVGPEVIRKASNQRSRRQRLNERRLRSRVAEERLRLATNGRRLVSRLIALANGDPAARQGLRTSSTGTLLLPLQLSTREPVHFSGPSGIDEDDGDADEEEEAVEEEEEIVEGGETQVAVEKGREVAEEESDKRIMNDNGSNELNSANDSTHLSVDSGVESGQAEMTLPISSQKDIDSSSISSTLRTSTISATNSLLVVKNLTSVPSEPAQSLALGKKRRNPSGVLPLQRTAVVKSRQISTMDFIKTILTPDTGFLTPSPRNPLAMRLIRVSLLPRRIRLAEQAPENQDSQALNLPKINLKSVNLMRIPLSLPVVDNMGGAGSGESSCTSDVDDGEGVLDDAASDSTGAGGSDGDYMTSTSSGGL